MAIHGLDFETSSEVDIDLGNYRYSEDPSTTIILFAVAKDDEDPVVWDFTDPDGLESQFAWEALREAAESDEIIRAFNVQMEIAVCRYVMPRQLGIPEPALHKWRDTQALCNRAAIQTNLLMASKDVGLPETEAKESIGKKLIAIFCDRTREKTLEPPPGMKDPDSVKPLKKGGFTAGRKPKNRKTFSPVHDEEILWDWLVKVDSVKMTVREAWNLFREYCRKDVISERAVARKLAKFELEGDILDSFQFDVRMNYKGVPINREAVTHAQRLVDRFSERMEARFRNLCGYTSSQNKALLVWLRERGYPGHDMQADTIEDILAEPEMLRLMTPEAQDILKMRNLLSFAALKKLKKMKEACCSDGYVRGTTKWHGARTGRATGSIIQPQNMRKATIKDSAVAYDLICMGVDLETFAFLYDSPLEAIASCIRHFMQPHEGMMLSADYKGVEARITPWLSGDMRKLQSILDGVDPYRSMAVKLFDVAYAEVSSLQRTIAKPVELGCCFGVGGRGLREALLKDYGIEKTVKECNEWVKIYRDNHPETVQCWRDIEEAAKAAIRDGKTTLAANGKLAFGRTRISGIVYLVMRLPSGRKLFYPHPEVKRTWKDYTAEEMAESEWKAERKGYFIDQISFYGRRPNNAGWGRITTWGSRLFENAVQATGADLLNHGCIQAERHGYDIRMIIHDEILGMDTGDLDELMRLFCSKQPWAESFPLESSGARVPYYLKDD